MATSKTPKAKVAAATGGAAAGTVVAQFVLWVLSSVFWDGGDIPGEVTALVLLVVPTALAFAAGYVKRETVPDGLL